jgi:AcrR family transcriptional regulator
VGKEQREAILAAAREILSVDPRASMTKLAAAARVSRTTLYRFFPSRRELLRAVGIEPDPATRERILGAALDLVGRDGLARLSMDELSTSAGVSRATLYRLFPGKASLFRELVRRYAPFDTVLAVLAEQRQRPPQELLPELARSVARVISARLGIVRTLLFEMTSGAPETTEAATYVLSAAISELGDYLAEQMERGRLRRMPPLLAVQSFIGPLLLHALMRPLAGQRLGLCLSLEDALVRLATEWVEAMSPQAGGASAGPRPSGKARSRS